VVVKVHPLGQERILPITLDEARDFLSNPRNFDSITPDDLGFRGLGFTPQGRQSSV